MKINFAFANNKISELPLTTAGNTQSVFEVNLYDMILT